MLPFNQDTPSDPLKPFDPLKALQNLSPKSMRQPLCSICQEPMESDPDQDVCGAECAMVEYERRLEKINNRIPEWLKAIGVPGRYTTDFPLPEAVQKFLTRGDSLLFQGPTGTGKTTTMVSVIRELLREKVLATGRNPERGMFRFVNYNEFFFEAQDVFRTEHDRILDYLKPIARSEYLFIDDLGKKRVTEFVRDALYYIIEQRDANRRPTFITTNMTTAEIEQSFDASITSRLMGMCQTVKFGGDDYRVAKRRGL